jgi:hypothetical protein
MEPVDKALEERQQSYATQAVAALEDMRGLARDAGKFAMKAGLPERFQNEAARLRMEIETLECQVSEYAVEITPEATGNQMMGDER